MSKELRNRYKVSINQAMEMENLPKARQILEITLQMVNGNRHIFKQSQLSLLQKKIAIIDKKINNTKEILTKIIKYGEGFMEKGNFANAREKFKEALVKYTSTGINSFLENIQRHITICSVCYESSVKLKKIKKLYSGTKTQSEAMKLSHDLMNDFNSNSTFYIEPLKSEILETCNNVQSTVKGKVSGVKNELQNILSLIEQNDFVAALNLIESTAKSAQKNGLLEKIKNKLVDMKKRVKIHVVLDKEYKNILGKAQNGQYSECLDDLSIFIKKKINKYKDIYPNFQTQVLSASGSVSQQFQNYKIQAESDEKEIITMMDRGDFSDATLKIKNNLQFAQNTKDNNIIQKFTNLSKQCEWNMNILKEIQAYTKIFTSRRYLLSYNGMKKLLIRAQSNPQTIPSMIDTINKATEPINAVVINADKRIENELISVGPLIYNLDLDAAFSLIETKNYEIENLQLNQLKPIAEDLSNRANLNKKILGIVNNAEKMLEIGPNPEIIIQITDIIKEFDDYRTNGVSDQIQTKIIQLQTTYKDHFATKAQPITSCLTQVQELIHSQKWDDVLKSLGEARSLSSSLGIASYLPQIETDYQKYSKYLKLINVLKVSEKVNLNDLSVILGIAQEDMIQFLMDFGTVAEGFKIDGDTLYVDKNANLDGLLGELDNQFAEWTQKEENKDGKIEHFSVDDFEF
jgi:hypothetical protein